MAILIPVILIGGFIALIFGIVFGVLNEVKDSEEYDLAYSYVVNSETFEKLDVDESEIKLTGYSTVTSYGTSHGDKTEFTFNVDGCILEVVCHTDTDDEWFVCDECTEFD